MPLPEYLVKYHEKTPVELTIEDVIKASNGKYVASIVNRAKVVASVQAGIEAYRQGAGPMSQKQLKGEAHDSGRLGEYLDVHVMKRPPRCHAHAVISGGHNEAIDLRVVMAVCGMRIDDPHNGCWLPENTAATPHPAFPKAVPHSRIHRKGYYRWLATRIDLVSTNTYEKLAFRLGQYVQGLHERTYPDYVIDKNTLKNEN